MLTPDSALLKGDNLIELITRPRDSGKVFLFDFLKYFFLTIWMYLHESLGNYRDDMPVGPAFWISMYLHESLSDTVLPLTYVVLRFRYSSPRYSSISGITLLQSDRVIIYIDRIRCLIFLILLCL
jgi:hypothetical protein